MVYSVLNASFLYYFTLLYSLLGVVSANWLVRLNNALPQALYNIYIYIYMHIYYKRRAAVLTKPPERLCGKRLQVSLLLSCYGVCV